MESPATKKYSFEKLHRFFKEPFPAISHLIGFGLSILGFIALLRASGNNNKLLIVSVIYGASLIFLYLMSTFNHGVHCLDKTARRLEQLDYAAIFLLIAGTYTPVCLLIIKGLLGWTMFAAEWLLALTGIISIFFGNQRSKTSQVVIYLMMGWMFLIALQPITTNVSLLFFLWLLGGSLFYSIGSIFFILDSRLQWRGYNCAHNLWHLMVIGGSTCHFIVINHFVQVNI